MLRGSHGGDSREGVLYNLVAMHHSRREVIKMDINIFGEAVAVGKTGDECASSRGTGKCKVADGFGGVGCTKRVLSSCNARFALEVFVEGLEKNRLCLPYLVRFSFPVPCCAVIGECVGPEQGGCVNCSKLGAGDGEVGTVALPLGLLESHDAFWHAGIVCAVGRVFQEEGDTIDDLKAVDSVDDVHEELERCDHFLEDVLAVGGDVMRLVDGPREELLVAVLCASNASLVFQFGSPDVLALLILPRRSSRCDAGIILGVRGFVFVE